MPGEGRERTGAEPLAKFGDGLAAGVVEVLAGGKNLHGLRSGALRKLKQTGMQNMVQEQMSRQHAQHLQVAPCAGREQNAIRAL